MPQSDKVQINVQVETKSTTEYCAADLPEGSVVATEGKAYVRATDGAPEGAPWRGTNGGYFGDWKVDEELANGAQVLRVGTGAGG
jgi:hypothetical protein